MDQLKLEMVRSVVAMMKGPAAHGLLLAPEQVTLVDLVLQLIDAQAARAESDRVELESMDEHG